MSVSQPSATPRVRDTSAWRRPGFADVVRSEWTKLWSVRSTPWTLLALFVVTVGFSALICATIPDSELRASDFDAASQSMVGGFFGQIAVVVIGVLSVTSEYSKGGIRSTLTAVPNRLRVVGAKALVVAAVTFVFGLVSCFVSFEVGQAILAGKDADVALGDPEVLRAVIGAGLYLMACAMFGFGLGVLLRQTAGAITGALVLLFVAPPLIGLIPGSVGEWITKHFTSNAGQAVLMVVPQDDQLGPWAGYFVFSLWWVVILAAGAALLVRRDAA
jgi:ABC-2 type transport system permease protein